MYRLDEKMQEAANLLTIYSATHELKLKEAEKTFSKAQEIIQNMTRKEIRRILREYRRYRDNERRLPPERDRNIKIIHLCPQSLKQADNLLIKLMCSLLFLFYNKLKSDIKNNYKCITFLYVN